jgi:hypothetical protein
MKFPKRFLTIVASLFIFSCLFPPWRATTGAKFPMGYGSVFSPPHIQAVVEKSRGSLHGMEFVVSPNYYAQIDFGRLFLEWAALAAITGMFWLLVLKPKPPRDDKPSCPQKIQPPTANPEK